MSRDHYLLSCDVTADMENTASSTVACWTVSTELLPSNALIKSVTISKNMQVQYLQSRSHCLDSNACYGVKKSLGT
jgi:hypothetical protein